MNNLEKAKEFLEKLERIQDDLIDSIESMEKWGSDPCHIEGLRSDLICLLYAIETDDYSDDY